MPSVLSGAGNQTGCLVPDSLPRRNETDRAFLPEIHPRESPEVELSYQEPANDLILGREELARATEGRFAATNQELVIRGLTRASIPTEGLEAEAAKYRRRLETN